MSSNLIDENLQLEALNDRLVRENRQLHADLEFFQTALRQEQFTTAGQLSRIVFLKSDLRNAQRQIDALSKRAVEAEEQFRLQREATA